MTGEGVPRLPASLDCSDEPAPAYGFLQALEHAYYSRDVEALRRVVHQVEQNMAALRERLAELTALARPEQAARVVDPERGQRTGSPAGEVR
jgi:hypothetical protein